MNLFGYEKSVFNSVKLFQFMHWLCYFNKVNAWLEVFEKSISPRDAFEVKYSSCKEGAKILEPRR